MLDILKSNLTEEDQQYFALVPPGFHNPVDVQRQGEILPGIVLPLYQKSVHDYIDGIDEASYMVDPEAVRICIQIARSLRALHKLGIVHCDLKPANILLNLNGSEITVALSDFGAATHLGERIKFRSLAFSPKGEEELLESTTKFDIFSFGIVMYMLVTGAKPVTDPTPQANQRISLVSSLLLRCVSKPTERPTADEIIEELTKIERAIPAHNRKFWVIFCFIWLVIITIIVAVIWFCCRRCRRRREPRASKNVPPTFLEVMGEDRESKNAPVMVV